MKMVTDAGKVAGTPAAFVTNVLTIVVPPGNPEEHPLIRRPGQAGHHRGRVRAAGALRRCHHRRSRRPPGSRSARPARRPTWCRLLCKVTSGVADAGLVYVTDASRRRAPCRGWGFPEASKAVNTYPIAAIDHAPHAQLCQGVRGHSSSALTHGDSSPRARLRSCLTEAGADPGHLRDSDQRSAHTVHTGLPGVLVAAGIDGSGADHALRVIGLGCAGPLAALRFTLVTSEIGARRTQALAAYRGSVHPALRRCSAVPLAVVLARGSVPGLRLLRSVVLLPLVLPPVVGGAGVAVICWGSAGVFAGYALNAVFGVRGLRSPPRR